MSRVHTILALLLFGAAIAACQSSEPRYLPPVFPEKDSRTETAPEPVPRGYVGDTATKVFHRKNCPEVEKIDPAVREYFALPYDALNADYYPCERCDPLAGWK